MPKMNAQPRIEKGYLGVAGEFAVASELCRRNILAQPTFGNQKRTDLLILNEAGSMWRVEAKAKQFAEWPGCRGIATPNSFLILVDFQGKLLHERPDFYVLSFDDWLKLCECHIASYTTKHPDRRAEMTSGKFVRFLDEKNAAGRLYEGIGIRVTDVARHKEKWEKIESRVGSTAHDDGRTAD